MCGICGFLVRDGGSPVTPELINRMQRVMRHRGPDESGAYVQGRIGLGHNRLSIIDLATGHQPIENEDGTKRIIFNGEIYNYPELRRDLLARGHRFTTHSDTEVILHLYEEFGPASLQHLRGMFAFAIWDSADGSLFLARDRLGKKPLYYAGNDQWFCFASEIKSLLVTDRVPRELNLPSVDQYISLNYTIGPRTMLRHVDKLLPGHYILLRDGDAVQQPYWDFAEARETNQSFSQCYEHMTELIEESVRIRLMSEVPLGAFLSGGVDSSVIVAVMTRLTGRPVKTFTVGYEDASSVSELGYARLVAKTLKAEHHEFVLQPGNFRDIVPEVVWHLDEPIGEYATIPLLLLSRLAKRHVTVLLSGEGADEIFAGYPIYRSMKLIEAFQRIPRLPRRFVEWLLLSRFTGTLKHDKYRDWLERPLESRYLGNASYFTPRMKSKLYTDGFKASLGEERVEDLVGSYYQRVQGRDVLSRMLYVDTKTWLPEDLLIKADKMTMAASVELRVPFLDHKLVEFAATLPSRMKLRRSCSKYIFKKYAETMLPREIVHRPKRGFPVPLEQWLKKDLVEYARDILFDRRTTQRGIADPRYVREMIDRHVGTAENYSQNIWNLMVLEIWMRRFLDGEGA
ncbi:MAG: asparagine synthase (glutamine-hydrolyzing) [Candidatus Geothermincolia bacterium]